MDLFGGEFGEITEKIKDQERQQNIEKLENQEMRRDYDLDNVKLNENQKEFYDLDKVNEEQYQISDILDHANELKLSESRKMRFSLQYNRNANFQLINKKKFFGDSTYMEEVKTAIHTYEKTLQEGIFGFIEQPNAVMSTKQIVAKTSSMSQIKKAIRECQEVLEKCNNYLGRHRSIFFWRWSRREAVENARDRFLAEKQKLEQIRDANDIADYAEDLKKTDSLLTLMNKPALEEKRLKRLAEKNTPKNREIQKAVAAGMKEKEKEAAEKKAVFGDTDIPRSYREAASQLAYLRGYDRGETLSCGEVLMSTITKDMPIEKKKKKILYLESMFDEILKCNPADFAFKDIKDIFGPKFTKNFHLILMAHDAEGFFNEYSKLLDGEDKDLLSLNKEQFKEVIAKREMLQAVYTYYDGIKKITRDDRYLHKDILSEMERPLEELIRLSSDGLTLNPESDFYSALNAMKSQSLSLDGKNVLYGPGKDPMELYKEIRKAKKLPEETKTVDQTRQVLSQKLKEDREEREEKKLRNPDTYGYVDFVSQVEEKYRDESNSIDQNRRKRLNPDNNKAAGDAKKKYEASKHKLAELEEKIKEGGKLTATEKKQLEVCKQRIKEYEEGKIDTEKIKKEAEKAKAAAQKAKENAVEKAKEWAKFTVEYDKAEKEKNEKIYKDSMQKCQKELDVLLTKTNLSAVDKKNIHRLEHQITLMVHNREADMAVYARNAASMAYKKEVGFSSVMDISEFLPLMGQEVSFDDLLRDFGKMDSINKVYDKMAKCLMDYKLDENELLSDTALLKNMEKYNALAQGVLAFNRLMANNPRYLGDKPALREKLDILTAASDYIRIKKQIFLSPANTSDPEITLKNYGVKRDTFKNVHHRRLLMVNDVMRRNLLLRLGKPVEESDVSKKMDNPFAEADRQFALRLSREEALQSQVDKKQGVSKEILDELTAVQIRISDLQNKADRSKGEEREKAILDLRGEVVHMKDLIQRYRLESDEDPSTRIRDALITLEEERLHVPFDFNMVPDFDKIPKKLKGDIGDIISLNKGGISKEDSDITELNIISKKMGYDELINWVAQFKKKGTVNNTVTKVGFKDAKSFINDISFMDEYNRVITHFYGSFHFHFTDAQMREQMVMLGFSDTFDCEAYRDDEKYMDYQEEAFKHMALRLNSQFQGVALRNMYGGMNKMLYMNFLDRMMALNPYMKAELMAMSAASNIHMGGNTGKYTEFITGMNTSGRFMPMLDNYLRMVMGYSGVLFSSGNNIPEYGLRNALYLSEEWTKKYNDFVKDYKAKDPGASNTKAGIQFLLKNPEVFNNKEAYKKTAATEQGENSRKDHFAQMEVAGLQSKELKLAFFNKYVPEVSKEELEEYIPKSEADGFKDFGKYTREIFGGFKNTKDPGNIINEVRERIKNDRSI